jgi:putative ABC transport system permease protein
LCIFSIAIGITLYLSVEKINEGTKSGFTNTISEGDLIVGASGGPLQLLLYTIFHIGSPVKNIKHATYDYFDNHPMVEWTIPISLGDSYKGHRVVATSKAFFDHYRFRGKQKPVMKQGKWFNGLFDVVLGHQVYEKLKHQIDDRIVLSHGVSKNSFITHKQAPFRVSGVLEATGTPFDQSVFISMEAMEVIHLKMQADDLKSLSKRDIKVEQLTSFILKAKTPILILRLQREINTFQAEPLLSIIPAFTLNELWKITENIEKILKFINLCVLIVALFGLIISLYSSLFQRTGELRILRSIGAGPSQIARSLLYEGVILVFLGVVFGYLLFILTILTIRPMIMAKFSLIIDYPSLTLSDFSLLGGFVILGGFTAIIPALSSYLSSRRKGLAV